MLFGINKCGVKSLSAVLILALFVISCNNSNEHKGLSNENGAVIQIDIDKSQPLMKNLSAITVKKLKDTVDAFPGSVLTAVFEKDFFVIMDMAKAPGIYAYDYSCNQKFYYNKVGQGPDELLSYYDIQICEDSIFILDSRADKIAIIDFKGHLIRKQSTPVYSTNFVRDDAGNFYYSHGNIANSHDGYNITYMAGDKDYQIMPIADNLKDVTLCPAHDLINFNGKVYFKEPSSPFLYELNNGNASLRYEFDFGEHWPGEDILKSGEHPYNIMQKLKKGEYVIDSRYFESDDHFCLSFLMADTYYYFVYNKETGDNKLLSAPKENFGAPLGFDPQGRLVLITRTDSPNMAFCTLDI